MTADGSVAAPTTASAPAAEPALRRVFERLLAAHGPQHWWPADTPFEVMLGAILTQNTAWTNVEKALRQVTARTALTPAALLALPEPELAALLRPVGYFNVKAARVRAFCAALLAAGGEPGLTALDTPGLRARLLAMHGIGPETADDMLLYAFQRPVFVIDAYTRRLFARLGLIGGGEPYEVLRAWFEQALGPDAALFNEYHALIVRHAKDLCRARRPRCGDCVLRERCPSAG